MAGTLQGAPELRHRLKAIKQTFKPVGRQWATTTAQLTKPQVPERTGKGRRSVRVKNASQTRATVAAIYYVGILDKGARAHKIEPKRASRLVFQAGGRTVFARKVHKPATRGRGFAIRASRESLRRHPMAETLIKMWNDAA
jgi:hypothetical protein